MLLRYTPSMRINGTTVRRRAVEGVRQRILEKWPFNMLEVKSFFFRFRYGAILRAYGTVAVKEKCAKAKSLLQTREEEFVDLHALRPGEIYTVIKTLSSVDFYNDVCLRKACLVKLNSFVEDVPIEGVLELVECITRRSPFSAPGSAAQDFIDKRSRCGGGLWSTTLNLDQIQTYFSKVIFSLSTKNLLELAHCAHILGFTRLNSPFLPILVERVIEHVQEVTTSFIRGTAGLTADNKDFLMKSLDMLGTLALREKCALEAQIKTSQELEIPVSDGASFGGRAVIKKWYAISEAVVALLRRRWVEQDLPFALGLAAMFVRFQNEGLVGAHFSHDEMRHLVHTVQKKPLNWDAMRHVACLMVISSDTNAELISHTIQQLFQAIEAISNTEEKLYGKVDTVDEGCSSKFEYLTLMNDALQFLWDIAGPPKTLASQEDLVTSQNLKLFLSSLAVRKSQFSAFAFLFFNQLGVNMQVLTFKPTERTTKFPTEPLSLFRFPISATALYYGVLCEAFDRQTRNGTFQSAATHQLSYLHKHSGLSAMWLQAVATFDSSVLAKRLANGRRYSLRVVESRNCFSSLLSPITRRPILSSVALSTLSKTGSALDVVRFWEAVLRDSWVVKQNSALKFLADGRATLDVLHEYVRLCLKDLAQRVTLGARFENEALLRLAVLVASEQNAEIYEQEMSQGALLLKSALGLVPYHATILFQIIRVLSTRAQRSIVPGAPPLTGPLEVLMSSLLLWQSSACEAFQQKTILTKVVAGAPGCSLVTPFASKSSTKEGANVQPIKVDFSSLASSSLIDALAIASALLKEKPRIKTEEPLKGKEKPNRNDNRVLIQGVLSHLDAAVPTFMDPFSIWEMRRRARQFRFALLTDEVVKYLPAPSHYLRLFMCIKKEKAGESVVKRFTSKGVQKKRIDLMTQSHSS